MADWKILYDASCRIQVYGFKEWLSPVWNPLSKFQKLHFFQFLAGRDGSVKMRYKRWAENNWQADKITGTYFMYYTYVCTYDTYIQCAFVPSASCLSTLLWDATECDVESKDTFLPHTRHNKTGRCVSIILIEPAVLLSNITLNKFCRQASSRSRSAFLPTRRVSAGGEARLRQSWAAEIGRNDADWYVKLIGPTYCTVASFPTRNVHCHDLPKRYSLVLTIDNDDSFIPI